MQGNIRIAVTLSTLNNKNILTTDWIENKFIKFIMLINVLKNPKWAIGVEKNSLLCFVLFANTSPALAQFPIPVHINLSQLLQNYQ